MNKIINRLFEKQTWERVGWYCRMKSWKEAPPTMKIPREDYLPILLTLLIAILILAVGIPVGMKVASIFRQ